MWPGRTRWSYPANTWKSWSPSTDPTPSVHRDDGYGASQQATTVLACALMWSLVAYVARPASLRGTTRRTRDAGTPTWPSLGALKRLVVTGSVWPSSLNIHEAPQLEVSISL